MYAQKEKRDEKIRIGFGISQFSSERANELVNEITRATSASLLELPVSGFDDHITFYFEYESRIWSELFYVLGLHYHRELVTGSSFDELNYMSQGLNYEITFVESNGSLNYYYPVFPLRGGMASLFAGAGLDLVYVNADFSYFFNQMPLRQQRTSFLRTGFIWGGTIYTGIEIPFIPAIRIQLKTGYSFKPYKKLAGGIDDQFYNPTGNPAKPLSVSVLEQYPKYDLSQIWVKVGVGVFF